MLKRHAAMSLHCLKFDEYPPCSLPEDGEYFHTFSVQTVDNPIKCNN